MLPDAGSMAGPADLGGDEQIFGIRIQRLGDKFLGDEGAIGVGGIDEVDAQFDGAAEGGECGCRVGGPQIPGPVMRMAP